MFAVRYTDRTKHRTSTGQGRTKRAADSDLPSPNLFRVKQFRVQLRRSNQNCCEPADIAQVNP